MKQDEELNHAQNDKTSECIPPAISLALETATRRRLTKNTKMGDKGDDISAEANNNEVEITKKYSKENKSSGDVGKSEIRRKWWLSRNVDTDTASPVFRDFLEGLDAPGDSGNPPEAPPWLDRKLFDQGRGFYHKYLFCVFLSDLLALLMMFSVGRILRPLIYTGRSDTPLKALRRYVSTISHVVLWFTGDVWDPEDTAHKDIIKVREIHASSERQFNSPQHRDKVDRVGARLKGRGLACPLHLDLGNDLCSQGTRDSAITNHAGTRGSKGSVHSPANPSRHDSGARDSGNRSQTKNVDLGKCRNAASSHHTVWGSISEKTVCPFTTAAREGLGARESANPAPREDSGCEECKNVTNTQTITSEDSVPSVNSAPVKDLGHQGSDNVTLSEDITIRESENEPRGEDSGDENRNETGSGHHTMNAGTSNGPLSTPALRTPHGAQDPPCSLHAALRQDLRAQAQAGVEVERDPVLYISQWDMLLTQYSFLGVMVAHPWRMGAWWATEEDMRGLVHFWRGVGWLLGIEDKYNFCKGTVEETRALCKEMEELVIKPHLAEVGRDHEIMAASLVQGISYMVPGLSYPAMLRFLADTLGFKVPTLVAKMSALHSLQYFLLRVIFHGLFLLPGTVMLFNWLLMLALQIIQGKHPRLRPEVTVTPYPYT